MSTILQPIHTELFYSDSRGPELVTFHWKLNGSILEGAEFMLPDATKDDDLRHVRFLRPQVTMITPEEVIDYRVMSSERLEHRPAAMFNLGRSDWLLKFTPHHLGKCSHFQLYFYDELLDIIAEDVTFGVGSLKTETK